MHDYRIVLLSKINSLLNEEWDVSQFRKYFYDYYLEQIPEDGLSDIDQIFFADVHEMLDWVDKKPDAESRKYGWIDELQYKNWLRRKLANYENNK